MGSGRRSYLIGVLLCLAVIAAYNVHAHARGHHGGGHPSSATISGVVLSNGTGFTTPATSGTTIDTLTATCSAGSCAGATFALATTGACSSATDNGRFAISGSNLNIGGTTVNAGTYQIGIAVTLTGASNSGMCFLPPALVGTGGGGSQTIASIALSNNTTTTGLSSGTAVGTLSVSMSAATPIFTGYTSAGLTLTPTVGGCNGADNASFQIVNDQLQTNGSPTAGTKNICVAATQAGAIGSPLKQNFAITIGTRIDAAAGVGTGGCTGAGTSGSPWNYLCIQNAVNSASNGDTVFLRGGNWRLNTSDASQVIVNNKSINLVGAGSGNTFDTWGHVNNAGGASMCPTGGSAITCVYTFGTSVGPGGTTFPPGAGGIIFGNQGSSVDAGCTNINISNINFDAEYATAGGDYLGILVVRLCAGPTTVDNIRHLGYGGNTTGPLLNNAETMIFPDLSDHFTIKNSMISEAQSSIQMGQYAGNFLLEPIGGNGGLGNFLTISNTIFYQFWPVPTNNSHATLTGSAIYMWNDGIAAPGQDSYYGPTGSKIGGAQSVYCPDTPSGTGQCLGTTSMTVTNNLFYGPGKAFAVGPGVNDGTTNGGLITINITGNWIKSDIADIDSCVWHPMVDQGAGRCASQEAMIINASVDASCNVSNNGTPFNITNNSLLGTSAAQLNGTGTDQVTCYLGSTQSGATVLVPTSVYGFNAQKNYLNSPSNQYLTDVHTISPVQSGNFCTSSAGSVTGCATSGFTSPPTSSFTLGPLGLGGIVPFTATNFTAQYGAVQWLASTTSTTPLAGDSRWSSNNGSFPNTAANSYIPPVSLSSVSHGNTVYLWVMDSANNISTVASALVP